MSGPLRSEDNDRRPEQMAEDPDRYFGDAWERSKHDVLAERRGEHKASTLVPGIVRMSLRGDPADVEQVVTAIERAGAKVFRGDSPGTRSGNSAGFRYFTVQVNRDG